MANPVIDIARLGADIDAILLEQRARRDAAAKAAGILTDDAHLSRVIGVYAQCEAIKARLKSRAADNDNGGAT